MGENADSDEEDTFIWKLRDELSEALDQIDLSEVKLKADPNENENIWLTQKMMASLYEIDVRTINDHIQKIYDDGELTKESTIRNFRIVQTEGNRQVQRDVIYYYSF